MKIISFKKLLSFLLVILLVCSLCNSALTNIVYAAGTVPVYDAATHHKLQSFSDSAFRTNLEAEFLSDYDVDSSTDVYTSFTVSTNYKAGYYSPFILLAETDYKESDTDTETWYLGVRLTMEHGWSFGLLNTKYSDDMPQCVIPVDNASYSNGTKNFTDNMNVTAKIGKGKASIWVDGICVAENYSNTGYKITKSVLATRINGFGYKINDFIAWTENETTASSWESIQSFTTTGTLTNLEAVFHNDYVVDNAKDVVRTTFDVTTTIKTGYYSPFILLAETDYKESDTDTETWYLGVRLTMEHGWSFGLLNTKYSDDMPECVIPVDNASYSNGTKKFTDNMRIEAEIGKGKASIWVGGVCVAENYSNTNYKIIKSVLGTRTNGFGYEIKNFNAYIEKSVGGTSWESIQSFNSTGTLTNLEAVFHNDYVVDNAKDVVRTTFDVTTTIKQGMYSPFILLAETDYKESDTDTETWYLGVRLTMQYGWSFGLLNTKYSDAMPQCVIPVNHASYSNGTKNFTDNTRIEAEIGKGKASIWVGGICVAENYSNTNYKIIKSVLGTRTNGFGYEIKNFNASVKVETGNGALVPSFNSKTQTEILNSSYSADVYQPENPTFYTFTSTTVNNSNAVYTKYVLNPSLDNAADCGYLIYLAKSSTEGKYYAIRITKGKGYTIGVASSSGTEIIEPLNEHTNQSYPSGNYEHTSPMTITVKVEKGRISLWNDESVVLEDYDFGDITSATVGVNNLGTSESVSIKAWTDNNNIKIFAPSFDSKTQIELANFLGRVPGDYSYNQELVVNDLNKPVYLYYKLEKHSTTMGWYSPYLKIADVVCNGVNRMLALRLTGNNGLMFGIYNPDTLADTEMPFGVSNYPDSNSKNMGSSYEIIVELNNGAFSAWMTDSNGYTKKIISNHSFADSGCTIDGIALGADYNYGIDGYVLEASAWTNTDNILIPSADSDYSVKTLDTKIDSAKNNLAIINNNLYNIQGTAECQEYTVKNKISTNYIALAETSYVFDGKTYFLGMKLTPADGYSIGLFNSDLEAKEYIIENAVYPDTNSLNASNDMTITCKTEGRKLTVWINGICVLYNHLSTDYVINGIACGANSTDVTSDISVQVWNNVENYIKIGDVNADTKINVIDFIALAKFETDDDAKIANDIVVLALGNDSASRLVAIKKQLLGVSNVQTNITYIATNDGKVKRVGRWNNLDDGRVLGTFQGLVEIRFEGSAVFATGNPEGRVYVDIDGNEPALLDLKSGIVLAESLPYGEHTLRIYAENIFSLPVLDGFVIVGKPLEPISRPVIEFVGDSITEGVSDIGRTAIAAYSHKTAEILNFDRNIVAQSGIWLLGNVGMANRYFLERPNLPTDHPKFVANSWDTSKFTPDYLVINLGTNDMNAGQNPTAFKSAYLEYLSKLYECYTDTTIFIMIPFFASQKPELATAMREIANETQHPNVVVVDTAGWEVSYADNLHLTDAGAQVAAENLAAFIQNYISNN